MDKNINIAHFHSSVMKAQIKRCPYCGSIEMLGNKCRWCHSKVSDSDIYNHHNHNFRLYE